MTAAVKKSIARHHKKRVKKPLVKVVIERPTASDWIYGMMAAAFVGAIVGTLTLVILITYVYPVHFA